MRILFALPGLQRYDRGAEIAFISVATELAKTGNNVTLIGSGTARAGTPYRFLRALSVPRENFEAFPSLPVLRNECTYEELTFIPDFLRRYRPADYDVTLTCSYPFINWTLRRPTFWAARPHHVFVTQNGDWPAIANNSEYRFFGCDGLVCTNPDFFERNKAKGPCRLIPNGVDCARFRPGTAQRQEFGLPEDGMVVLMVSALIPSKRVEIGIEAVGRLGDAHLVIAGDGPLRKKVDALAATLLPDRFTRLSVTPDRMPALYRSADVFLHLSKEEAFGNVFLEALASGVPVVAHDTGRTRWIVGNNEFLLDTDDVTEMVRQIELARETGPAKRNERAKRTEDFSWTRIAKMYHDFFHEVIDAPRTHRWQ
jgi:glycosyltransferase involved in cell wall biosynthesis